MTVPLYSNKKTISEKTLTIIYSYQPVIIYLIINGLIITSLSDLPSFPIYVKIILSIILISGFGFPYYIRRAKNPFRLFGTEIGVIDIQPDLIKITHIDNQTVRFRNEDLDKISIHYLLFGRILPVYRLNISLFTKEGNFDFEMNIKPNQKKVFRDWLENQYKNGTQIQEFNEHGLRAFLLNANLDYQQIQEVKQRYKMEWNLSEW